MEYGAILLILALVLLFVHVVKNFTYWRRRNVRVVTPVPFFGNYWRACTAQTSHGELYKDIYNSFPRERVVGVYRMVKPELIVRHPEDIERVLKTDFNHFYDRQNSIAEDSDSLSYNLFHMRSETWKNSRQKLTKAFSPMKMKMMFQLITTVGGQFVEYMNEQIGNSAILEARDLMARFAMDVIGSCAFGISMNSMVDDNAPFRVMGNRIFSMSESKRMKYMLRNVFPSVFKFLNLKTIDHEAERWFKSAILSIVKQREASGIIRNDFVDMIIEMKKEEFLQGKNAKVKITNNFICAQAFSFFAAGYESSATLMSFTLHELAMNPDIQENVYQEICKVLRENNQQLTYDSIEKMIYLNLVLMEAERKYPAVGVLIRLCTKKYTFPGTKITIDPGTTVAIPVLALHYDKNYYSNPERFEPERFTEDNIASRPAECFLPFGQGPRNCIAARFGKYQSLSGLIYLLTKYKVEPCSITKPTIEFDPTSIVYTSKNGVWLKFTKRANF